MKRPRNIFVFLIIACAVIVVAGFYLLSTYQEGAQPVYPYGQTDKEKADALKVAFSDKDVQKYLENHTYNSITSRDNTYRIQNISAVNPSDEGFINSTYSRLMRISFLITGTRGYFDSLTLNVTVDTNTGKIVKMKDRRMIAAPHNENVAIPPGASWYYTAYIPGYLHYSPDNATVYAIQVDRSDLEKYVDGLPCAGQIYDSGQNEWINVTVPLSGHDMIRANSSGLIPTKPGNENFLIFQNSDNRDVSLSLTLLG